MTKLFYPNRVLSEPGELPYRPYRETCWGDTAVRSNAGCLVLTGQYFKFRCFQLGGWNDRMFGFSRR
jgi:hypothetical protein